MLLILKCPFWSSWTCSLTKTFIKQFFHSITMTFWTTFVHHSHYYRLKQRVYQRIEAHLEWLVKICCSRSLIQGYTPKEFLKQLSSHHYRRFVLLAERNEVVHPILYHIICKFMWLQRRSSTMFPFYWHNYHVNNGWLEEICWLNAKFRSLDSIEGFKEPGHNAPVSRSRHDLDILIVQHESLSIKLPNGRLVRSLEKGINELLSSSFCTLFLFNNTTESFSNNTLNSTNSKNLQNTHLHQAKSRTTLNRKICSVQSSKCLPPTSLPLPSPATPLFPPSLISSGLTSGKKSRTMSRTFEFMLYDVVSAMSWCPAS